MQKLRRYSLRFVQTWLLSLRGLGILVGLFVLFSVSQIYLFNRELEQFQTQLSTPSRASQFPSYSGQSQKDLELKRDLLLLRKERINLQNGLAQSLGGLFFFFTVYFTWRNLKATEDKQIAERFSKAIEQLGSPQQAVRVGGIFSLERIAKDSPKDHWTIIEVLSSFVREAEVSSIEIGSELATDLQAALTVIGRRDMALDPPDRSLNLRGAYLVNANLAKGNFQSAILAGANLSHADLRGAKLSNANLKQANLTGASLAATDLSRADLTDASLQYLNTRIESQSSNYNQFTKAKLVHANLSHAILQHADFRGANLREANFTRAGLRETDFTDASLIKVDFSGADLSRVDFSKTNLQGTLFIDSDIHGATFIEAKGLTEQRIKPAKNAKNAIYDSQQSQLLSQILDLPKPLAE